MINPFCQKVFAHTLPSGWKMLPSHDIQFFLLLRFQSISNLCEEAFLTSFTRIDPPIWTVHSLHLSYCYWFDWLIFSHSSTEVKHHGYFCQFCVLISSKGCDTKKCSIYLFWKILMIQFQTFCCPEPVCSWLQLPFYLLITEGIIVARALIEPWIRKQNPFLSDILLFIIYTVGHNNGTA